MAQSVHLSSSRIYPADKINDAREFSSKQFPGFFFLIFNERYIKIVTLVVDFSIRLAVEIPTGFVFEIAVRLRYAPVACHSY